MEDYNAIIKVALFVSIQGIYVLYIMMLRPQDSFKENLNDFINEIFYLYFVVFLLYFNTENRWGNTSTEAYFWILMSNNFILIFIMLEINRSLPNNFDDNLHHRNSLVEESKESLSKEFMANQIDKNEQEYSEKNDGLNNNFSKKINSNNLVMEDIN